MADLLTASVECVACTAAQGAGDLFPTFSLTERPHSPHALMSSTESLAHVPPASVTFSMAGLSWRCAPSGRSVQHGGSSGVTYQTPYTPLVMQQLQSSGYGKHLVFLSCPDWQYALIAGDYSEDDYLVYFKASDVYPSDGFTVNDVLRILGGLAGMTITSTLPTLHVSNAQLTFQRGTPFLDMFRSLLPSGLPYLWEAWDNRLRIGLLLPTYDGSMIPPDCLDLTLDEGPQVPYDLVTITGGLYKPTATITVGKTTGLGSASRARAGKYLEETLDPDVQDAGDATATTTRTRGYYTDLDGNFFYTGREDESTTGAIFGADGNVSGQGVISTLARTFSYENTNAAVYEEPRLLERVETESGYATTIAQGQALIAGVSGVTYYLTADLTVVTKAAFDAMDEPPTVLLTAGSVLHDPLRYSSEKKTYITQDTATRDLPEGLEKLVTLSSQSMQVRVNGLWFSLEEDPMSLLSRIAGHITAGGSAGVTSFSPPALRTASSETRRITPVTAGGYTYTEQTLTVDTESGAMKRTSRTTHMNAKDLPSAPSKYRMKPLEASAGKWGDTLVVPTSASVPTNNPADFSVWAGLLYQLLTQPDRSLSFRTRAYALPIGAQIAGGTISGFSVKQQGPSGDVSYTLV